MWSSCEPSKPVLDFQETLKLEVTEKREAIPDTSAVLTKSDCCASLVADKNGKTDNESDTFRKGMFMKLLCLAPDNSFQEMN